MLAYALSGGSGEIEDAAEAARRVPEKGGELREVASMYVGTEHSFCPGRGVSYTVAIEAALKLRGAATVHAEGFAVREFLHGPLQLVNGGTPVFVYAASRGAFEASVKALEGISGYRRL